MKSLAEYNADVIARENYLDPPEDEYYDAAGPARPVCPECGSPDVTGKDYGDNTRDCLDCGIWFVDDLIYSPIDVARLLDVWKHDMTEREAEHAAGHALYDGTTCGAWITFDEGGIVIGSIVEGVEETASPRRLSYPFLPEGFWVTVEEVEADADHIWMATHGCDACGEEDFITGYIPVNPDCTECGGDGIAI